LDAPGPPPEAQELNAKANTSAATAAQMLMVLVNIVFDDTITEPPGRKREREQRRGDDSSYPPASQTLEKSSPGDVGRPHIAVLLRKQANDFNVRWWRCARHPVPEAFPSGISDPCGGTHLGNVQNAGTPTKESGNPGVLTM
jgi:hypothetical protein